MFEKPTALYTLGLEQGDTFFTGVELTVTKGEPHLLNIFKEPNSQFQEALKKCLVVTPLETNDVLVRSLEVPLKKEKDIDAVLAFQAEPLIPYSIENATLDRVIIEKKEESTQLTLLAARNDHILKHLEKWHEKNIEPETISCIPVGLATFSKYFIPSENPHIIIHITSNKTTCVLIQKGKVLATQTSLLGSTSPDLSIELTKLLYALEKQLRGRSVKEIVVTGSGSELKQKIAKHVELDLINPIDIKGIKLSSEEILKYALPIGLALGSLPKSKNRVNFRQNQFVYPHPWKRLKKPMFSYLGFCFLLSFFFYLFGSQYIKYKEDQIREEFVEVLSFVRKPYSTFEAEYSNTTPDKVVSVLKLSQSQLLNRINKLNKELRETPNIFALHPNLPRVTDILAWLSTHPNVIIETEEGEPEAGMQLESFSYKIIKRPAQNKPKEKYQAKVEIEFTTPTPRIAREFHDSLLEPNDIINPNEEVKWTAHRGKYKASFILKDKTFYP